jgi:type II secretory pathway pseudopilin PulG
MNLQRSQSVRRGFTMAEAMIAMSLLSVTGAALLLDTAQLVATTDSNAQQFIADGLAQQMIDEISGMRYMEVGTSPYATTLGPESNDAGVGRSNYDDIDDYNGLVLRPPSDRWNVALGTDNGDGNTRHSAFQLASGALGLYQVSVQVYYVNNTALTMPLPVGTTSSYRNVQVQVTYFDPRLGAQTLATLNRVFTYVPAP